MSGYQFPGYKGWGCQCLLGLCVREPPLNLQGVGGLEFLSRTNYLFQPGSAAH